MYSLGHLKEKKHTHTRNLPKWVLSLGLICITLQECEQKVNISDGKCDILNKQVACIILAVERLTD